VTTDDDTQTETSSPTTPTIRLSSPEPFATYQRSNAWDEVPEIERYISNLPQNRRAKIQVLTPSTNPSSTTPQPPEALNSPNPSQPRRPSMKLTDFPTEIERPSLPVTPAPVHRPSFWGAERDAQGELPAAEGVPEQSEWDPARRLEELQRRQSVVLGQGPGGSPGRAIPDREVLGSASLPGGVGSPAGGVGETATGPRVVDARSGPDFRDLDFSGGMPAAGDEERGRSAEVAPNEV